MFNLNQLEESLLREEPQKFVPYHRANSNKVVSNYADAYFNYMQDIDIKETLTIQSFLYAEHRIIYDPDSRSGTDEPVVRATMVQRCGAVITYHVNIGPFSVEIKMLNTTDDFAREEDDATKIAKGSYGEVLSIQGLKGEFVAKRIAFMQSLVLAREDGSRSKWRVSATFEELKPILLEFAIAKLCFVFGVGVPLKNPYGFDMVCFPAHVEFYMEKCWPPECSPFISDKNAVEKRLKYCLRVMHLLKIVHKDVKPQNILYSSEVGDLVLCDFGISRPVNEEIGFKTLSYREGTIRYMSPDMREIPNNSQVYVDLYYIPEIVTNSRKTFTLCSSRKQENEVQSFLLAAYEVYCNRESNLSNKGFFSKQLARYFPELDGSSLQESYFNVNFLLASIPIYGGEFEHYLNQCDLSDARIRSFLNKLSLSKKLSKIEETQQVSSHSDHCRRRRMLQRDLRVLKNLDSEPQNDRRLAEVALELFEWDMLEEVPALRDIYKEKCEELLSLVAPIVYDTKNEDLRVWFDICKLEFEVAFSNLLPEGVLDIIRRDSQSWSLMQLNIFQEHLKRDERFWPLRFSLLERKAQIIPDNDIEEYRKVHTQISCLIKCSQENIEKIRYFQSLLSEADLKSNPGRWCCAVTLLAEALQSTDFIGSTSLLQKSCFAPVPKHLKSQILLRLAYNYRMCQSHTNAIRCSELAARLILESKGETLEYLQAKGQTAYNLIYLRSTEDGLKSLLPLVKKHQGLLGYNNPITSTASSFVTGLALNTSKFDELTKELTEIKQLVGTMGVTTRTNTANWSIALFKIYQRELLTASSPKVRKRLLNQTRPLTQDLEQRMRRLEYVDPNESSKIYLLLGRHYVSVGDSVAARPMLLKAYETAPFQFRRPEILALLCSCQTTLKMEREAAGRLLTSKSISMERMKHISQEIYLIYQRSKLFAEANMCYFLRNKGEALLVVADIKKIGLGQTPGKYNFMDLSSKYMELGWFTLALELLVLQLATHPRQQARYLKAQCHYELKEQGLCIDQITTMINEGASEAEEYWFIAKGCNLASRVMAMINEVTSSNYLVEERKWIEVLLGRDSRHVQALHRLAAIYDQERDSRSLECLWRAFAASVGCEQVNEGLCLDCGIASYRIKQYSKALYYFGCCAPTSEVLYHQMRCYLQLGRSRRFYKTVKQLTERQDNGPYQKKLREHLKNSGKRTQLQMLFGQMTEKGSTKKQEIAAIVQNKRQNQAGFWLKTKKE